MKFFSEKKLICAHYVGGKEEIRFSNAGPNPNKAGEFVDVAISVSPDNDNQERPYKVKNTANNGHYIDDIASINFKALVDNTPKEAPLLRISFFEAGTDTPVVITKSFYISFFDFDTNEVGTAGLVERSSFHDRFIIFVW